MFLLDIVVPWDPESFWSMIEALVLVITLPLIYWQLRTAAYANMLTTYFHLDEAWRSPEMRDARERVCLDFIESTQRPSAQLTIREGRVIDFLDELGTFVDRKILDKTLVWDSYSHQIEHLWPILEKRIEGFRKECADASYYEGFESLYAEMRVLSLKRPECKRDISKADLQEFAEAECELLREESEVNQVVRGESELRP